LPSASPVSEDTDCTSSASDIMSNEPASKFARQLRARWTATHPQNSPATARPPTGWSLSGEVRLGSFGLLSVELSCAQWR
jgi:hypothetical protein